MAMTYQKGTVYLSGKRVKKWYGKFLVYFNDQEGKETSKQRNIALCPKAGTPKWRAEQMLKEIILKECSNPAAPAAVPDGSLTFRWFVHEKYIPLRAGTWSPAYTKTNTYQLDHYLVAKFGDLPLSALDTFEIQIWLNGLAKEGYSEAVVRQCFSNIRAIMKLAKRKKYVTEDPTEDVSMPQTEAAEKPVMSKEQLLSILTALNDLHDLCLLSIGIFCGPRSSEVLGFQWASWNGESLTPLGTAWEGHFYAGRTKTKQSKRPIPVPDQVRSIIEAWRVICPDDSPEALMFPTFGRGKRLGEAVPRSGKNFLRWRIRPITRRLGIPDHLVTFQVMRRTLATHLQDHGSLKDAQGILRHASIRTTADIYVQPIDANAQRAVNSRTTAVLDGWTARTDELGQAGRNFRPLAAIRRSSAKLLEGVSVSC